MVQFLKQCGQDQILLKNIYRIIDYIDDLGQMINHVNDKCHMQRPVSYHRWLEHWVEE